MDDPLTTPNVAINTKYMKLAGMIISIHLITNAIHVIAHSEIPVFLPPALTIVVLLSEFGLPIIGVVLLWRASRRLGAALFTLSMAIPFGLGLYLHFLVTNPDHVLAVPASPWQLPFQLTAVAIAVTDAIGIVLGAWLWWTVDDHRDPDLPQSGRIEGVPGSGVRPLIRLTYWVSRRWFGDVPEPVTVMAHHRGILWGTNAFEIALDNANRVDERLTELAVLKAALLIGCEFCIDIGTAEATKRGITEEQLRALADFEDSEAFSAHERLVLRYAVAMTMTPTDVPDEVFNALAEEFDEAELVELTAAIAFENYRGRFNHAFGLGAHGFSEGEFCPLPETPPSTHAQQSQSVEIDH